MNHVANTLSASGSGPPLPENGQVELQPKLELPITQNGVETADEETPMEPREPIVRSVPSIELPEGKNLTILAVFDKIKLIFDIFYLSFTVLISVSCSDH